MRIANPVTQLDWICNLAQQNGIVNFHPTRKHTLLVK